MHLNGEFELQLIIEDRIVGVGDGEGDGEGEGTSTLMSANQFSMIEVFGNTTMKEVKLGNPLSFDQCCISSVSLYTDIVLHNVSADQVVVINAGTSSQKVLTPRGTYDIETIIAMLNVDDAFPVRIRI